VKRHALVTGVSGGLGGAIAAAFRDEGWAVTGVDLKPPSDQSTIDRFERADLASDDGVADLLGRISDISSLHALVNNAAVQVNEPLVDTSDDQWALVMNTNVRAAFQLIRGLTPALRAAAGSIVNVSSVHALATSVNVAAYAISKGALLSLTRTAALELAPDGIRCNTLVPGAIDTPMLREGLARRPHPDGPAGNLELLIEKTPVGFIATPEQLTPTVLYLADNERSPYTTGQMIVVDGGATLQLSTE
jgi:NAD(P)-dependent dehydrogenase (short-subunit alcohol dehydrogenase family)